MRTYTHGVIGYLLYAKRSRQEQRLAMMGGILPDVLLAMGFIPHYLADMTHSATVASLHHLLHHSDLHIVTVSLHSFIIVGPLLILSSLVYKPVRPLFVGMLAHSVIDLLTHKQWAYNHFFPIRLEPIRGIFSYTDVGFTIVEHTFLILFVVWWIIKRRPERARQTSDEGLQRWRSIRF
jgi:membrane-bound metal-dependent hydrolase YbcI (DUF457 family)